MTIRTEAVVFPISFRALALPNRCLSRMPVTGEDAVIIIPDQQTM